MLKALDGLDADADARAETLSRENGKVRFEAAIDLQVFVGRFHQAAEYAPALDEAEHIAGPPFTTTIAQVPEGVVTIIYPLTDRCRRSRRSVTWWPRCRQACSTW